MKRLAISFTGPSNSGKTTLIEKVANTLIANHKVVIIKNDPKDKAEFDVEGKDSWRFFNTGAEVVVASPTRTTYFSHRQKSIDEIIKMVDEFDYLLVEGLKTLPLPKIAIFRNTIDKSYLSFSKAIAIDNSINIDNFDMPSNIDILDLNNTQQIIDWININAKVV